MFGTNIFGIGVPELMFIAILALIILGPQRLPGVMRELAKFVRQMRAIGTELTSQFSEEMKLLDELNPTKIFEEATRPTEDDAQKAKSTVANSTAKKPAAKTTGQSTKPSSPAKKTTSSQAASKTAANKPATTKSSGDKASGVKAAESQAIVTKNGDSVGKTEEGALADPIVTKQQTPLASTPQSSPNGKLDEAADKHGENRIVPPEKLGSVNEPTPSAINGSAQDDVHAVTESADTIKDMQP